MRRRSIRQLDMTAARADGRLAMHTHVRVRRSVSPTGEDLPSIPHTDRPPVELTVMATATATAAAACCASCARGDPIAAIHAVRSLRLRADARCAGASSASCSGTGCAARLP